MHQASQLSFTEKNIHESIESSSCINQEDENLDIVQSNNEYSLASASSNVRIVVNITILYTYCIYYIYKRYRSNDEIIINRVVVLVLIIIFDYYSAEKRL